MPAAGLSTVNLFLSFKCLVILTAVLSLGFKIIWPLNHAVDSQSCFKAFSWSNNYIFSVQTPVSRSLMNDDNNGLHFGLITAFKSNNSLTTTTSLIPERNTADQR